LTISGSFESKHKRNWINPIIVYSLLLQVYATDASQLSSFCLLGLFFSLFTYLSIIEFARNFRLYRIDYNSIAWIIHNSIILHHGWESRLALATLHPCKAVYRCRVPYHDVVLLCIQFSRCRVTPTTSFTCCRTTYLSVTLLPIWYPLSRGYQH